MTQCMLSLVQGKHIPRGHIFPLSCFELILYETNSQMYTGLSIHKCLGKLLAPLAVSLFRHTEVKKKKKVALNCCYFNYSVKSRYVRHKSSGKMYKWAEMSIFIFTFYLQQWINNGIHRSLSISLAWITKFLAGWFHQAKNKGAQTGPLSKVVSMFTIYFSLLYLVY